MEGVNVFETLKAITRECLKLIPDPSRLPEGRTESILSQKRPSMHPDAPPASGSTDVSVPAQAKVPQLRDPS